MAMVFTTKGDMDESLLEKREGTIDTDHEHTQWIEYWHDGELVHRSAHVVLRKAIVLTAAAAKIG